jgi:ABC-type antimicrobial peptide transport system permease subunit
MFQPGSNEIVVGAAVERQFAGVGLGEALGFAQRRWTVVGIFDGGRSAFDSEIWGDAEQLQQAFRRTSWSSVIARLASHDGLRALQAALSADPRLQVEVQRERQFYQDEARGLATFINVLGLALAVIFSLGATIGAAITMYASVANRTAEIGTLRALGFGRRAILGAFLIEALLLALVGGVAGLAGAALLQGLSISATNFQSFSELAFGFAMTPRIVVDGLLFALAMGLVGGVLPAIKAARLKIVDALRAA